MGPHRRWSTGEPDPGRPRLAEFEHLTIPCPAYGVPGRGFECCRLRRPSACSILSPCFSGRSLLGLGIRGRVVAPRFSAPWLFSVARGFRAPVFALRMNLKLRPTTVGRTAIVPMRITAIRTVAKTRTTALCLRSVQRTKCSRRLTKLPGTGRRSNSSPHGKVTSCTIRRRSVLPPHHGS